MGASARAASPVVGTTTAAATVGGSRRSGGGEGGRSCAGTGVGAATTTTESAAGGGTSGGLEPFDDAEAGGWRVLEIHEVGLACGTRLLEGWCACGTVWAGAGACGFGHSSKLRGTAWAGSPIKRLTHTARPCSSSIYLSTYPFWTVAKNARSSTGFEHLVPLSVSSDVVLLQRAWIARSRTHSTMGDPLLIEAHIIAAIGNPRYNSCLNYNRITPVRGRKSLELLALNPSGRQSRTVSTGDVFFNIQDTCQFTYTGENISCIVLDRDAIGVHTLSLVTYNVVSDSVSHRSLSCASEASSIELSKNKEHLYLFNPMRLHAEVFSTRTWTILASGTIQQHGGGIAGGFGAVKRP